jgi:hypothetical protein
MTVIWPQRILNAGSTPALADEPPVAPELVAFELMASLH